jgi:hypothetical protein
VRLGPRTGYGTLIGATGINVSGIAFDRDGVLYAIGGASGPGANKLHTLNLLTGAATYVMDVASGGGKGFAYNPDDGLFYHKYYLAPTHGFEKIDPLLQTRSSITLSGDAVAPDVTGMTYAGDGVFLASGGPWYSISSTGTVTQRTEGGDWFKGLLFNSLPNALRIIDNSPVTVTQNAGVASGGFFPVGTTTNTYTVTDASMNAATYTLSVTVEDVEAPVLVPLAGPIMRVRNNINNCGSSASNYEEFPVGGLYASVSDNCGATVRVLSVSSDEADDNDGNGDGCTEEDVDNMYVCDRVELRIECDGGLDGRVYTILLEARDPAGNTAGVPCYVHVKKNAASNVVEGPALYTLPCPNTGSAKQWISRAVPALPSLEQNYPNPFNPVTEIRFVLPSQGRALLQVIDIHGRVLRSLVDENFTAGPHVAVFEAADLPSGVYLYRLQFGGRVLTRSMVLLR